MITMPRQGQPAGEVLSKRLFNAAKVSLVRTAARLLPPRLMSALAAHSSSVTGIKGASVPQRSATMYGMMAVLPNRGDLREMVLDVLDGMTAVDGASESH